MSKALITIEHLSEDDNRGKFLFRYNGHIISSSSALYKYRNSDAMEWMKNVFDIIENELFFDEYVILIQGEFGCFSELQHISKMYSNFDVYDMLPEHLVLEFKNFFPDEEDCPEILSDKKSLIETSTSITPPAASAIPFPAKQQSLSDIYKENISDMQTLKGVPVSLKFILLTEIKNISHKKMQEQPEVDSVHLLITKPPQSGIEYRYIVRLLFLDIHKSSIEELHETWGCFVLDPLLMAQIKNNHASSLCVQLQLNGE